MTIETVGTYGESLELKDSSDVQELIEKVNTLTDRMLDRIEWEQKRLGRPLFQGKSVFPKFTVQGTQLISSMRLVDRNPTSDTPTPDRFDL
jgi:hypothetical protein